MTKLVNNCNGRTALSLGVVALGLSLVTTTALANEKTPPARISSTIQSSSVEKLSGEEWRAISLAAGRILKHTAQARAAIVDQQYEEATAQVEKGLTLVRIIRNALPKRTVTAEIKSGNISYRDKVEVSSLIVPIYEELDRVEIMVPIVRAKRKDADESHANNETNLNGTPEQTVEVVSFEGIEHSATKLDVSFAKEMLGLAKKRIAESKPFDADNALRAIQAEGVFFEFDEVSLPLARAADNLKLAEFEMKEGWTKDAKLALEEASDALKEYEAIAGTRRSKDVQGLQKEIDRLTKSLDKNHSKQDVETGKTKVSGWWDRVAQWFRR